MNKKYTRLFQRQPAQRLAATAHDPDKESNSGGMRLKPQAPLQHLNKPAHPVTAIQRQQLVLELQRQLGNRRVAGVLLARRCVVSAGATQRVSRQTDSAPFSEDAAVDPVPPVTVTGEPHEVGAFAGAPSIRLQGRTNARFNGGTSKTENLVTKPGSDSRRTAEGKTASM